MPEIGPTPSEGLGDYVLFVSSGMHVKGEFHCAECGYGVTVYRELPRCPMCGAEDAWEQLDFARAFKDTFAEGPTLL